MTVPVTLIVIQIKQNGALKTQIGNFMMPADACKMLIKSGYSTAFYNKNLASFYLTCLTLVAGADNKRTFAINKSNLQNLILLKTNNLR